MKDVWGTEVFWHSPASPVGYHNPEAFSSRQTPSPLRGSKAREGFAKGGNCQPLEWDEEREKVEEYWTSQLSGVNELVLLEHKMSIK